MTGLVVAMMMLLGLSSAQVDFTTCGSTKGCYRIPGGCDGNCELFLTWVQNGNDRVDLELGGTLTGNHKYVTVAFSKDKKMGDDSVIDCTDGGGTRPIIEMSYNTANAQLNEKLSNPTNSFVPGSLSGSYTNGDVVCRMTRYIAGSSSKVFDLNQAYNLLFAKGQYIGSTKIDHGGAIWTASGQVNVGNGDTTDVSGSGNALVAVHGIFMVLAWMVSCGVAILLPRYFKDAWPGKKLCGKPIWFQMHQALMFSTLILNVLAFILIFVEVKGYASYQDLPSKAHPPLGIITTILCIANPIMAVLRPNPDHPKRIVFKWAHFSVGVLTHIFAVVTIFIGVYMAKSKVPAWGVWIMVIYIIFHCLIELGLALHMHLGEKRNATNDIKMDGGDKEEGTESKKGMDKKSMIKTILLVIYAVGVLALSIVLMVPIGQA